jgi:NAD+ synthase (glutamine-hydrolysing)
MPSQYTSDATHSDATQLAERLGIELLTVPIEPVFGAYTGVLSEPDGLGRLTCGAAGEGDVIQGVTAENVQARIRGNILMALSNRFGWLVLATGNKSEIAVGYCTLYGDMAGGFAVIKDVPKTLVYRIANHVNSRRGVVIPETVLERAPSAELRPGQKDTDSLPPYPVLDEVLRLYVEEDAAPDDIVAAGFEPHLVHNVVRMVDRN